MNRIVWRPWNWSLPDWDWENEDLNVAPPADIADNGNEIVVRIQIPGFKKEDIKITVDNTKLTVSGSVSEAHKEEDKKKFYRKEIQVQKSFSRSFSLPEMDAGQAKAKFENGELIVTVPKSAKSMSRTVSIDG